VCEELAKATVLWSKDTRDWSCPSVEEVVASAVSDLDSGDIILFHDYNAKTSPTPSALRCIIPSLLEQGYKFVVASELLKK
jgi:peptidoglycan/xylan/chitin deacetylase (PgdA/CDA1 family)